MTLLQKINKRGREIKEKYNLPMAAVSFNVWLHSNGQEKIEYSFYDGDKHIHSFVRLSTGSLKEILSLLDQVEKELQK